MLMVVNFLKKKSSFCENGKFIDFKMALRGKDFCSVGTMGHFTEGFFVGWWESEKECF